MTKLVLELEEKGRPMQIEEKDNLKLKRADCDSSVKGTQNFFSWPEPNNPKLYKTQLKFRISNLDLSLINYILKILFYYIIQNYIMYFKYIPNHKPSLKPEQVIEMNLERKTLMSATILCLAVQLQDSLAMIFSATNREMCCHSL